MVRREICARCRGNRWIRVRTDSGKEQTQKCPECGGQGYKIRITR